jgi:transposase-like protein
MSETTRNELKEMFAGKRGADRSALVRQAARLIVEEALESEATQELGRGYYEHGADARGYRNGYRTGKVKTAEGVIEFAVPQVSDTAEPFRSQIRQVIRGRTEELERLAVEMYPDRRRKIVERLLTCPRAARHHAHPVPASASE